MPSLTATVAYVNDPKPGKKNGSIKLGDGTYLGVRPNMLSQFSAGKTYDIEYEEHDYQGQTYKTVKTAKAQVNGASAQGAPPQRASWSPKDSEHAFVTKILGDAVRGGQIELTVDTLTAAVRMLRKVHKQGFADGPVAPASQQGQQVDPEMNDEIPF